jgi:hypothetical protein
MNLFGYQGNILVTSTGAVSTTGNASDGIDTFTAFGNITINSNGTITTTGTSSTGIEAQAYEDGDIQITSTAAITTSGATSNGIYAYAEAGNVQITSSAAINTSGNGSDGIGAFTNVGNVQVSSSAAIRTTGSNAYGIFAIGSGNVAITSTSVTTTGANSIGIAALQSGPGILSHTIRTVSNAGANAPGIFVRSAGNATVNSTTVTTTGAGSTGIDARATTGTVSVTSGTVSATGTGSAGIIAIGSGNTSVTSTTVTSSGTGILAQSTAGTATVTSGNVTTSGASATGIVASATGAATVTSSGTVTTANGHGIVATSNGGAVSVDANNVNVTGGGANAIAVTSATTSTVTIRGLVTSAGGLAIQADVGAATVGILASGTVRGRIDLTDNADTVNNAGRFEAAGDSAFGAGTDIFNKSGLVTTISGAARFLAHETFNNLATGRIDMRDGAVGDTLTVGNYIGTSGSRLQLDANLATNLADVLITGVATGSTILDVNLLGNAILNTTGTLVVDATAGTSATAFTLAGGITNNPFIALNLLFDAPNNNFLLVGNPQQPVFETIEQGEMVTNFWYDSADAITAQLEAARDGLAPAGTVQTNNLTGDGRFGGWVQGVAGNTDREATNAFGNSVFDTSYQQDYLGVQAGLDYQSGGTILGVSFGYGKSDAEFDVTFNRVEMTGYNLGAYAAFQSGGFFFNAIAKIDWVDVDSTPGAGLLAEFDANVWGLRGTMGYRFNTGNVFIEPSVTLSYVNADIDDYTVGGATVVFDDIESFRGAAGIRIGGEFRSGNGTWSPFVGAFAVEEFSGDNRANFTLGQTIGLAQDAPGTWGELQAGINYSTGRLEIFARGELDFGGEREGLSGRAGVRLLF